MYKQSVKIRLLIATIAIAIFFVGLFLDNYIVRMIAKPVPLFVFISLLKPDFHYRKFIFIGLIFSVIGDLLLEASPNLFVFGLVAFLIAHVNFIIAFINRGQQNSILATILILLYGAGLYWVLYPNLNSMAIPVLVYVLVILTMVWRAFAQRKFDKFAIYALVGSLFFVFSDSLIALNKFYMVLPYSRGMIMLTYWTAQFLIFYSAFSSKEELKSPK